MGAAFDHDLRHIARSFSFFEQNREAWRLVFRDAAGPESLQVTNEIREGAVTFIAGLLGSESPVEVAGEDMEERPRGLVRRHAGVTVRLAAKPGRRVIRRSPVTAIDRSGKYVDVWRAL